jgi:predicted enzyme related to lactoylglutathione lyase
MTTHGTVAWFQVDTDNPDGAQQFYGELFNWTFESDAAVGNPYRQATAAGADHPQGAIADTKGESPNWAIFFVIVSDVAAAVAQAEKLGGKVILPPKTTPDGLTFAKLADPSGNVFGVYTEPAR